MIMFEVKMGSFIKFGYTNWEGIVNYRTVEIKSIYYGFTEYHQQNQWLMKAWDFDKNAIRVFAMNDMVNVIEWK